MSRVWDFAFILELDLTPYSDMPICYPVNQANDAYGTFWIQIKNIHLSHMFFEDQLTQK